MCDVCRLTETDIACAIDVGHGPEQQRPAHQHQLWEVIKPFCHSQNGTMSTVHESLEALSLDTAQTTQTSLATSIQHSLLPYKNH